MTLARTPSRRFVCAALVVTAPALYAQDVTLEVSHFLPPNSNDQKGVLEPWCDKLVLLVPGISLWLVHLHA